MTKYKFDKIHGAGNDFVLIDDMNEQIYFSQKQIALICNRHMGIGADGLILVRPPRPEANNDTYGPCDAFMCYYNSDGTVAQMCGNGVRCFAKFLVDRDLVDVGKGFLVADTLAGPKRISFVMEGGELISAKVEMGAPILEAAKVPTTLQPNDGEMALGVEVTTKYGTYEANCISMGNPHCVIFMDNPRFFDEPDSFPLFQIGPELECHEVFPEKCNIEFAYVDASTSNPTSIKMRVWERGCGETMACGTGACATGVATFLTGRGGRRSRIQLLGGFLDIDYREDGTILMTGPAKKSFEGTFEL